MSKAVFTGLGRVKGVVAVVLEGVISVKVGVV